MPEWVIWGMVAIVGIPSILVIIWPMNRYKNVTRKEGKNSRIKT